MKKVRYLRIFMRTIQYGILFLFALVILFCLCFVISQDREILIDYLFAFSALIFCAFLLFQEIRARIDPAHILVKFHRSFYDVCGQIREASDTEREIVQSFFEKKGWKMPPLFTAKSLDYIACVSSVCGKTFLLVDEHVYQHCSLTEIWTILAHENGHLLNGDMFLLVMERRMFFFLHWFPRLAVLKILVHLYYFPEFFLVSFYPYLFIFLGIVFFCEVLQKRFENILELISEILADNSAAIAFGSSRLMLKLLEDFLPKSRFFSPRKKALLWVCKKDVSHT